LSVHVRSAAMADIDELTRLFDGYRMFYEQTSDLDLARSFLKNRIEKTNQEFLSVTMATAVVAGLLNCFRRFHLSQHCRFGY